MAAAHQTLLLCDSDQVSAFPLPSVMGHSHMFVCIFSEYRQKPLDLGACIFRFFFATSQGRKLLVVFFLVLLIL